uniref:Uncharacterized protein n=1 Tax=Trypanosoma vivax (strain Y486) TaxID=1055687 RepID=G0TR87_TRYVY|nr:hypothetical protein, unlikely [Trypanosoma vivax Y486]
MSPPWLRKCHSLGGSSSKSIGARHRKATAMATCAKCSAVQFANPKIVSRTLPRVRHVQLVSANATTHISLCKNRRPCGISGLGPIREYANFVVRTHRSSTWPPDVDKIPPPACLVNRATAACLFKEPNFP